MKKLWIALVLGLLVDTAVNAQAHQKGDIYLSAGVSLGAYATTWEAELVVFNIPFKVTDSDGAASVTYPINFQYGITERFSLGAYIEPGQYLDSTDSETNSIVAFGISPRFHVVNGGKVNWFVNADLGATVLTWKTSETGDLITKGYNAFHWRLGTGMNWFFSNSVGLFVSGTFGSHNFTLNRWEQGGQDQTPANYTEKLKAAGGQFNIGLALRL